MGRERDAGDRGSFEGLDFVWYPPKAVANLKKHNVSFEEAVTVFGDEKHIVFPDSEHSYEEERYLADGHSKQGRLLVLCFTERAPKLRLISARLAESWERMEYETANE
jgi:uncharacterized DUF497 family protein